MKITSIIFLILSAVLIVGGLFVCSYAKGLAPNEEAIDGPAIEDGQIYDEIDFDQLNVSRIALNLENCTVTLHGGAKQSHVELNNFEPNKYIGNVTNKTLTVSNNISISDYLNLDGSGVQFSGVWRMLRSYFLADKTTEKTVDIYLSDEEDIKQISLTVTGSDVKILDVSQSCDITVNATDSTVEFNSLNFSTMTFNCTDSELSMLNVSAKAFNLEMNSGELALQRFEAETMDVDIRDCKETISLNQTNVTNLSVKLNNADLSLTTDYAMTNYKRTILLEDGEITLNGEVIGSSETFDLEGLPGEITVEGKESNVNLRFGEGTITPPDTAPGTGTEPESKPDASTND